MQQYAQQHLDNENSAICPSARVCCSSQSPLSLSRQAVVRSFARSVSQSINQAVDQSINQAITQSCNATPRTHLFNLLSRYADADADDLALTLTHVVALAQNNRLGSSHRSNQSSNQSISQPQLVFLLVRSYPAIFPSGACHAKNSHRHQLRPSRSSPALMMLYIVDIRMYHTMV